MSNTKYVNLTMYFCMFVLGFYLSSYQAVFKLITNSYNFDSITGGTLIAAHFAGSLAMPLVFGEIADRIGKRKILIFSSIAFIVFLAAIFLSSDKIILFISIFLIGGFFIVIEGIGASVISLYNPLNIKSVMNFTQTFFCVGCVAGPLIAGFTLRYFENWRSVYLLNIVLILILMVLFFNLEDDTKKIKSVDAGQSGNAGQSGDAGGIGTKTQIINKKIPFTAILMRNTFILLSTVIMLLYVGIEEGFAFWMISYIEKGRSVSNLPIYALSAYWLFMGIGRFMASIIKKRHNAFLFSGMVVSMISVACIFIFTGAGDISLIMMYALTGFGLSSIWPLLVADTIGMYPEYSATASGILMTSGSAGAVLIPLIMGVIAQGAGMRYSFVSIFFMMIMMFALFILHVTIQRSNSRKKGRLAITGVQIPDMEGVN
ncbi:MAG: MFS transporter [Saccharofermentanales bacterium]